MTRTIPTVRAAAGPAALLATVLLWSSFALMTRALGTSGLTTLDLALLRFATPLVLLAPWVPGALRRARQERTSTLALLMVGGLPHFLVFAVGAHLTSAGLTGLLVPGTVPLFVTLLLLRRRSVPRGRVVALALITGGVAVSASTMTSASGSVGVVALLAAGLLWAVYTLGLARTTLGLLDVVALVSLGSTVGVVASVALGLKPSAVLDGTAVGAQVLTTVLLLGVGTGIASTLCYAQAIRQLGSGAGAVAGASSPVLTATLAAPLLGEPLGPVLAFGLVLVVVGLVLFHTSGRAPSSARLSVDRRPLLVE
ncbi:MULTISPECIES: EamA family transporter [unclassified Aeromicrobium]|uniref:EamA family transporter n=1 Tax=unclassified Aeromicrobium TaxID=2633570 RepID=UPI00257DF483|nr:MULTISPECIES: EamA family transporter [unclassified Aeromicrobium]